MTEAQAVHWSHRSQYLFMSMAIHEKYNFLNDLNRMLWKKLKFVTQMTEKKAKDHSNLNALNLTYVRFSKQNKFRNVILKLCKSLQIFGYHILKYL